MVGGRPTWKDVLLGIFVGLLVYVGAFYATMKMGVLSVRGHHYKMYVPRWAEYSNKSILQQWMFTFFEPLVWVEKQVRPDESWVWREEEGQPKPDWMKARPP